MNNAQIAESLMLEKKLVYKIGNNICSSNRLISEFHKTYTLDDDAKLIDVYDNKIILTYSDGSSRVILGNFG